MRPDDQKTLLCLLYLTTLVVRYGYGAAVVTALTLAVNLLIHAPAKDTMKYSTQP